MVMPNRLRPARPADPPRPRAAGTDASLGILFCLHPFPFGGEIVNPIETAAGLRARGHRVWLFYLDDPAGAGPADVPWALSRRPALELARARGVPVLFAERPAGARAPAALRRLSRLLGAHRIDVVHSFGDTALTRWMLIGAGLRGIPVVVNDYRMQIAAGHPRRVPLVVGTRRLVDEVSPSRPGPTVLVEPPVDVTRDSPHEVDGGAFRRAHGIRDEETLLVVVSRFDWYMKLPGITGAIDAVARLHQEPVRLLLVGGGEAEAEVRARAEAANRSARRPLVVVPGALVDPRPAYAAADIVLGMGHSALRAAAFGKPVIVLGAGTFSLPLTPETASHFGYEGFYGHREGGDLGAQLVEQLRPLIADRGRRDRLGKFGRQLILQRYSIDVAVDRLAGTYRDAVRDRSWSAWCLDAADASGRRAWRGIREVLRRAAAATARQPPRVSTAPEHRTRS